MVWKEGGGVYGWRRDVCGRDEGMALGNKPRHGDDTRYAVVLGCAMRLTKMTP